MEEIVENDRIKPVELLEIPDISNIVHHEAVSDKLLAYNLPGARKQEIHEYLEECALRAKVRVMMCQMKMINIVKTYQKPAVPKDIKEYSETLLKKYACKIATSPIEQSWLDNIQKMLPPKIPNKLSSKIKCTFEEVKQEYSDYMCALSMHMIFSLPYVESESLRPKELKPDVGGKTKNYHLFQVNKRFIRINLFLPHPLIRKILYSSNAAIPETLIDFKGYRKLGLLPLDKLITMVHQDLKKAEQMISRNWYPKLIKMISGKSVLEDVPHQLWARFVRCASTIVSAQITQLMQRTINDIIKTISNANTFPQIKLDAVYVGGNVTMVPSTNEIFNSFHRIIDTISYMGQDMPAMEAWFAVPCPNKFVSVKRSDSFLRSSHVILEKNLKTLFKPILEYLSLVDTKYSKLSSAKQYSLLEKFLNEDHSYQELFEKIDFIKTYADELKQMVQKEYFSIAVLCQDEIISHLKRLSHGFINRILQAIVSAHKTENEKICEEFNVIANYAIQIPNTTEELVLMGQYMKYNSTVFIDKIKDRILRSIQLGVQLVDYTNLSEEHLSLNVKAINWLSEIIPIFDECSSLYEVAKNDLEERLQKTTEKLNKDLEDLGPLLMSLSNMDDTSKITEYVQYIQKFLRNLELFDSTVTWINKEEQQFKFPISTYPELDELKSIVHPFAQLIFTCNKWFRTYKVWMDGAFEDLVLKNIEELIHEFQEELLKIQLMYKAKCKQQSTDNYPRRFKGVVDDPDVNNWPAPLKLCAQTIQHIKDFRVHLRLIGIICNPALSERHWKELSEMVGFDLTPDAGTTLRKIFNLHLEHLLDKFEIVSVGACKELELLTQLSSMQLEWTGITFKSCFSQDPGVQILCNAEEILSLVDNHIIKSLLIWGSAFISPIEDDLKSWHSKLERIAAIVELWLKVQKQWIVFIPLFTCRAVWTQISEGALIFQGVHEKISNLMEKVKTKMVVLEVAGSTRLLEFLKDCWKALESVDHEVKKFIDEKRRFFPRLFLLSDDNVLEILVETKNLKGVSKNINKCFHGISSLSFDSDQNLNSISSSKGENVTLIQHISTSATQGCVEKLLAQLEVGVKDTLRHSINQAVKDYSDDCFSEWIQRWPSQVVLCASEVIWTAKIQLCLQNQELQQLRASLSLITKHIEEAKDLAKKDLSRYLFCTICGIIILKIHTKDILLDLVAKEVVNEEDFSWVSQLRYYWEDSVTVRMINASLNYGFEYLGSTSRLVITPLTMRCYRTLVTSYHMNVYGALEGPTGTGKTETVKDLAKAIAVVCFEFNCSKGLNCQTLGNLLKGLACAGAWACFDEFNRIEQEVLSVVAQQIACITQAVCSQETNFVFEDGHLKINPNCYICITLTPFTAAPQHIPINLKVLFRPVAMMVPDINLIAEIMLLSYGFENTSVLASKIVTLTRFCSEQLKSQPWYNFGLNSVIRVLSAVKRLKEKFFVSEEDILFQSLTMVFLPQIMEDDLKLFKEILSDLFPSSETFLYNNSSVVNIIKETCIENKIEAEVGFIGKLLEAYELKQICNGIILVGQPFTGKTTILKILSHSLYQMNCRYENEELEVCTINPVMPKMEHLYGQFDPLTQEWKDGIISKTFRKFTSDVSGSKIIIFDGPMDSEWVDSLNSVLEDNKKLCLSSTEVLPLCRNLLLVFEVTDLLHASPATISRCGLIFLSTGDLSWRSLMKSWIQTLPKEWNVTEEHAMIVLLDWLVPPLLTFVQKHCHQVVYSGVNNHVKTTMDLMFMLITDACSDNDDYVKHIPVWSQAAFILGAVWGLGGNLSSDSQETFDHFFKDILKGNNIENIPPENFEKLEVGIPNEGLLYDYWYIFKTKGNWRYWPEAVRSMKMEENPNFSQLLVPTTDSSRYMNLIETHISHNKPLMLVGPVATGKTFYFQKILTNTLFLHKYVSIPIVFSRNITASFIQDVVLTRLQKKSSSVFGPPDGKTAVVFIDDLNMPKIDSHGFQPPTELFRQYIDHGYWYCFKTWCKFDLKNILLIAASGLPCGFQNQMNLRFTRHFSVYTVNNFSEDNVTKIFSTLLLTGFKRNGFATDVQPMVFAIISATSEVLVNITNLRPIPSKPHYLFNIRDFFRLVLAHLLLKRESVDSKKVFIKLWVHEAMRVFYDRLNDSTDRSWLFTKLKSVVNEHFKESFETTFENLLQEGEEEITEEHLHNLIFTTSTDGEAFDDKKYEEVGDIKQLYEKTMIVLNEYNLAHVNKMDIVLFNFALEHLYRISRVLAFPGGSCLLVGVGGSGRQSLARLASFMSKISIFTPKIGKAYGFKQWREDLKFVLRKAGGYNTETVLIMSESHLNQANLLQDLDDVLSSGTVPNIYTFEEMQDILKLVRLAAQGGNRNLDIDPYVVYSYFVNQCKQNLHIVLSFSPIGSSFRKHLMNYRSLLKYCTIDWFQDWPEEALEKIASHYLGDINLPETIKVNVTEAFKYFHVTAREAAENSCSSTGLNVYITSASYRNLIKTYTKLIPLKQEEVMAAHSRYKGGLDKLEFAASQVLVMQHDLEKLQPQLKIAANETVKMMEVIERETTQVEKASALVREDEKVAKVQATSANGLKTECEADLALAIPILEEAVAALNTLKPADITLVKSMKNPPDTVKLVMAAVCVMKDIRPEKVPDPINPGRKMLDYWGPSKRLLGDMAFLQQLKEYDKDNIPPSIMVMIRKQYLPNKDFKPHIVAKASSAAEGLCKWVIAMDMYDGVAKEVAPKKAKLEIAEREFAATMAILEEKRAQVRMLEEKLVNLNNKLDAAQQKKKILEDEVALCSNKLTKAEKLIGGLGGEKGRWSLAADALQNSYECLAGDILMSCGVIAYLAPFTQILRLEIIKQWQVICKKLSIPTCEPFSLSSVLGSDIKIRSWNIAGLPRDMFSIDNAIIVEFSTRWPLLLDPQGHGNQWIKNIENKNKLEIFKIFDENHMKKLEDCMLLGKPVLIENMGEVLDCALEPILLNQTFIKDDELYINIADTDLKYNCNFRLYLTTKLDTPQYLPAVFNKATVINFTLTLEGLEGQLLSIVVTKERPDLQEHREMLIIESAENEKALKEIESSILQTLSSTKGNILENESAIDILDSSKILSVKIKMKQLMSKEKRTNIEQFRLGYLPVAKHSAVLYQCLTDLQNINPMYQFSLAWFISVFEKSMENASKLMLDESEVEFFLNGNNEENKGRPNPGHSWLTETAWAQICKISNIPSFSGFIEHFTNNLSQWQEFFKSSNSALCFPEPWTTKLNSFQKLLLIKIAHPVKLVPNVIKFVEEEIDAKYVFSPDFNINDAFEDSSCIQPLILLLSPGINPLDALTQFAKKKRYFRKFKSISLGQNQEAKKAEKMIESAQCDGGWICLENCHLALPWISYIEQFYESLTLHNTSMDFRLWLTTNPIYEFPSSILQNSCKITIERVSGLQQNLLWIYNSEQVKETQQRCPGKENMFAKLLYGLSFFHVIVQERKKFGSLSWNIPYEFSESDFFISLQQLQMLINDYTQVSYEAILYVIGECNYGGNVKDLWDRRTLMTLLTTFCNRNITDVPNYQFQETDYRYKVPLRFEHNDFINAIKLLPDNPSTEIYGLHENSGILYDIHETHNLFKVIKLLKGRSDQHSDKSYGRASVIADDILSKLPSSFDIEEVQKQIQHEYEQCLNMVLIQEFKSYDRLLSTIRDSLDCLKKTVHGNFMMTDEMNDLATSLLNSEVPLIWSKVSTPSFNELASFISNFLDTFAYFEKFLIKEDLPQTIWLAGFFFPKSFMNGILQSHGHKNLIPLEQLCFDFEVITDTKSFVKSNNGILVKGLFIEGAIWDCQLNSLQEQNRNVFFDEMPTIWFKICHKSAFERKKRFSCPLYRRRSNSASDNVNNCITVVYLNSLLPEVHWIRRGVSLLCQTSHQ